eukprot:TRINITY_DN27968_c0_g1_i2.p1 TRINITY_DN27968_c0_g1~~TRINITY_DN27968_c0_g1_i2.p1  ORF type:complete len:639 (+),score=140.38 TRINITY_DN27968_c0_g1_i2:136-2052(+)
MKAQLIAAAFLCGALVVALVAHRSHRTWRGARSAGRVQAQAAAALARRAAPQVSPPAPVILHPSGGAAVNGTAHNGAANTTVSNATGAGAAARNRTLWLAEAKVPLPEQLALVESRLPREWVSRFDWQTTAPRAAADAPPRPHQVDFVPYPPGRAIPAACGCDGPGIQPKEKEDREKDAQPCNYMWCVPNLGRPWKEGQRVLPMSFSLPEEDFVTEPPEKDQDSSIIIPGATPPKFTAAQFRKEYGRSFYCLTFKKGGWWALRHVEIVAAGCMPYFVDIEAAPTHALVTLPKKILYEARELPGVHYHCARNRVFIDHAVFPRRRYDELLRQLITHARRWMTSEAVARFVLASADRPVRRVLWVSAFHPQKAGECRQAGMRKSASRAMIRALAKAAQKHRMRNPDCGVFKDCDCHGRSHRMAGPLRAQGSYAGWTLLLGLRRVLGSAVVDTVKIPFLYDSVYKAAPWHRARVTGELYGAGFGYAWRLEDRSDIDRSNITGRARAGYFDIAVLDTSLIGFGELSTTELDLVDELFSAFGPKQLFVINDDDVPLRVPWQPGYRRGTVLQREISDCTFYIPPDNKSQVLKRCVNWAITGSKQKLHGTLKTGACFDDTLATSVPAPRALLRTDPSWWTERPTV